MKSNPYDPKLLEAWFRFMADATKASSSANEMFQQTVQGNTGQGSSGQRGSSPNTPPNFAEMMTQFYSPANLPANLTGQPEVFNQMTETWLASFGMVPKSRYDALEAKYEELLGKFKESERTVQALRTGQEMSSEQTKEVLKTWEDTVQKTLEAQSAWWQSWSQAGQSGTSPQSQEVSQEDKSEKS